jgi:uncharacterized protein YndB with AHSA1/START domain
MSTPPIVHGNFTIERTYDAPPSRVYRAWADPALKARWFVGPQDWTLIRREHDFRVGGAEVLHGRFASGKESLFSARYHQLVPDERLVYVYDMHVNGAFHSVSLATIELKPEASGTRLVFTEQVAFVDGSDGTESRKNGSGMLLDKLGESLR